MHCTSFFAALAVTNGSVGNRESWTESLELIPRREGDATVERKRSDVIPAHTRRVAAVCSLARGSTHPAYVLRKGRYAKKKVSPASVDRHVKERRQETKSNLRTYEISFPSTARASFTSPSRSSSAPPPKLWLSQSVPPSALQYPMRSRSGKTYVMSDVAYSRAAHSGTNLRRYVAMGV